MKVSDTSVEVTTKVSRDENVAGLINDLNSNERTCTTLIYHLQDNRRNLSQNTLKHKKNLQKDSNFVRVYYCLVIIIQKLWKSWKNICFSLLIIYFCKKFDDEMLIWGEDEMSIMIYFLFLKSVMPANIHSLVKLFGEMVVLFIPFTWKLWLAQLGIKYH